MKSDSISYFWTGVYPRLTNEIIGEYVGSIHTQVRKLPLVTESERINFEET